MAVDRTFPNGRVIGIDIIPALPPKGVSTIQGNFLSPSVQSEVKRFLRESDRGRAKRRLLLGTEAEAEAERISASELEESFMSYLEAEKKAEAVASLSDHARHQTSLQGSTGFDAKETKVIDIILSDMSEPWAQTDSFWKRSLSDPYYRMMNTSGMPFRDHAGSMVSQSTFLCSFEHFSDAPSLVRICAMPRSVSRVIHCASEVILSANSIRGPKTKPWKSSSKSSLPRFIAK